MQIKINHSINLLNPSQLFSGSIFFTNCSFLVVLSVFSAIKIDGAKLNSLQDRSPSLIFYWLFMRLSIMRSLSCSSCLLRSLRLSRYILSATLLLFSTILWMHVYATVWNLVTSYFNFLVFRFGWEKLMVSGFDYITGVVVDVTWG